MSHVESFFNNIFSIISKVSIAIAGLQVCILLATFIDWSIIFYILSDCCCINLVVVFQYFAAYANSYKNWRGYIVLLDTYPFPKLRINVLQWHTHNNCYYCECCLYVPIPLHAFTYCCSSTIKLVEVIHWVNYSLKY